MNPFTRSLEKKGRFGDTLIAHLSQTEANVLKKAGGAGTVNPFTGALEFYKGTMNNTQAIANTPPEEEAEGAALDTSKPSVGAVFADAVANFENMPDNSSSSSDDAPASRTALAVATILNNTRLVHDDNLGHHKYVYFSSEGHEPSQHQSNTELDNLLQDNFTNDFRYSIVGDGGSGATNEDLVARDMSIFLRAIGDGGRKGNMKRSGPLVSKDDLFKAYEELGITPYNPEGKYNKGFYSDEGGITYDIYDNKPVSLAQQEVTDAAVGFYNRYNSDMQSRVKSSADADGTGGGAPGAGHFASFGAMVAAMSAPASYNQGSFANLFGMVTNAPVGYVGAGRKIWSAVKNYMNSPSTNPATGEAWRTEINPETHFGDAPAYSAGGFDSGGFISAGGGYGVSNNTGAYNQNGGYSGFSNPNGVGD